MNKNTDKYHLIMIYIACSEIKIGCSLIKWSNREKLLVLKIDTKMSFDNHIKGLCRKANSRLGTLGKVTPYMGLVNKLQMNSFTTVPYYGCFIVEATITKLLICMKDTLDWFIAIIPHLMKNYWKETDLSLFITKIYKLLQLGCLKI